MNILGISGLYHDSAACLVDCDKIVAAVQEERFSRIKNDRSWPNRAISFCKEKASGKIDYVAFYEDPVLTFDRVFKSMIESAPAGMAIAKEAIVRQLHEKSLIGWNLQELVADSEKIFFVQHHYSHAASAFFPSPMEKSAILVVDAVGEWATTSIFSGSNNEIKLLEEIQYPHSLGLLYSAITFFCGFKVNSGEYKLMGLAPFGRPLYADLIYDKLIMVNEDGSYRLNLEYFAFQMSDVIINERFDDLFKIPRRAPETEIKQGHADVAASIQVVLDEVMVKLSRHAMEIVDSENLCLAGGVALNCVANSKIRDTLKPGGMWVQPAAGDAGGALGAALYVRHNILEERRVFHHTNTDSQSGSFLGPSFSDKDVLQALEQSQLKYDLVEDRQQHHKIVAKQISEGKIVGRFFGKMEFGPRSLGGRSILADPRSPHAQKYVNLKIKFRESWRPFAPAVLAEKKHFWFSDGDETPYMLYTSKVLPGLFDERHEVTSPDFNLINQLHSVASRSRISAVTHVDRSARVQTVDALRNRDFYDLISEFETLSDCPILLNTSFNIRGEPIVCSPQDAINCFLATEMDVLSIQNFLVFKQPNKQIICSD